MEVFRPIFCLFCPTLCTFTIAHSTTSLHIRRLTVNDIYFSLRQLLEMPHSLALITCSLLAVLIGQMYLLNWRIMFNFSALHSGTQKPITEQQDMITTFSIQRIILESQNLFSMTGLHRWSILFEITSPKTPVSLKRSTLRHCTVAIR